MASVAEAKSLITERSALPQVQYAFQGHGDPASRWAVLSVQLEERVALPYRLELELTSEQGDSPDELLGKPCTLAIRREEQARCVHGVVSKIAHHAAPSGRALRVVVVPALDALRHRVDSRIFSDKTVPEVLDIVLGRGLAAFGRKHASTLRRAEYPRREYIVQYRESDLAFVQRLMAEEGIWYRFTQSDGAGPEDCELLTLFDGQDDVPAADLGPTEDRLPLELMHGRDAHARTVDGLHLERRVGPSGIEVMASNWSHPEVREGGSAGELADTRYEPFGVALFQYDGQSYTRSDAAEQARLRWDGVHGGSEVLRGLSNLEQLAVGTRIVVAGHSTETDGEWFVTSIVAHGHHLQLGQSSGGINYRNHFAAQRFAIPFRPARVTKPRAHGVALGHVVGADGKPSHEPSADDIHTDEHGRVRVKLSWDRTEPGSAEATTTCWLRVAQRWAGAGFGAQFVPRVGMEVVVDFVDGDPDNPIVTGCLYNGLARAAHPPREESTKTYLRTRSSPGGGGYNELLFDDAKHKELVSLRAERDHSECVRRNQTLAIGGARTEHVAGDERVEVEGARTHVVHGAETLRVVDGSARLVDLSGDETKLVAKSRELVVSEKTSETYLGGRRTLVQTADRLEVADGAHKRDHVSGHYDILADEHFKVLQGDTELYLKDTFYVSSGGALQLKNAGFRLYAGADGRTTIDVGKKLSIRVGDAIITLASDGTISLEGARGAKIAAGESMLQLQSSGAELSAAKLKLAGTGQVEVRSAKITLN